MMHFSCDLCRKGLSACSDLRYVVKMEVYAAHDPSELTDDDLDTDNLEVIGQILAEEAAYAELAPSHKKIQYDLCPSCHKKFLADPLGRESLKFEFSEN